MEKVFESLERLAMPDDLHENECKKLGISLTEDYETLKQFLLEIEAIKKAKPSEALEELKTFSYIMTRCKDEDSYIIKFPLGIQKGTTFGEDMEKAYNGIHQTLLKSQEQEKVLNELLMLINDLEPTFNRKGVSNDIAILGTIFRDYFTDNASDLLRRYLENEHR